MTAILPAQPSQIKRSWSQPKAQHSQWIESVFDTLKGQLGLERHGGRTTAGVYARVGAKLLAMSAAIWHNWLIGAPRKRSLIAYDH